MTEDEDFLSQSQEDLAVSFLSGMNNRGALSIGNKRTSATVKKKFDIPVPTITGKDPTRLSVI